MVTKIRCDDDVIVLTGKDKGKRGRVISILSIGKAIVKGINLVKKHQKPMPSMNLSGGIIKKEAAIDLSNLAIFNSITNKADRIGFKIESNKKKRFFKSNGKLIK